MGDPDACPHSSIGLLFDPSGTVLYVIGKEFSSTRHLFIQIPGRRYWLDFAPEAIPPLIEQLRTLGFDIQEEEIGPLPWAAQEEQGEQGT